MSLSPFPILVPALSYTAQVTASNFYSGAGSATAQGDALVGRTSGSGFNAGGFATQYVQLELASSASVCQIALLISQSPSGTTQHILSAGATASSLSTVTTHTGFTTSGQWLNTTYSPCLSGIRFIRVTTTSSPSWVAWVRFLVSGV